MRQLQGEGRLLPPVQLCMQPSPNTMTCYGTAATPAPCINQPSLLLQSKASSNDAAGAEYYYRAYIQAGGEPQVSACCCCFAVGSRHRVPGAPAAGTCRHLGVAQRLRNSCYSEHCASSHRPPLQAWMLSMLLGTYGRLRQADRAWAIYRALRGQGAAAAEAAAEAAEAEQQPWPVRLAAAQRQSPQQQWQQQQQQQADIDTPAAPAAAADGTSAGGSAGEAEQERQHAWDARLAARRRQLADWAEGLVRDLRLDAVPLNEYGYGALLTALSRVGGWVARGAMGGWVVGGSFGWRDLCAWVGRQRLVGALHLDALPHGALLTALPWVGRAAWARDVQRALSCYPPAWDTLLPSH